MAIRLPVQVVLDQTITDAGTGSVSGGWAYPFKVPADTDNIVVKFAPSVVAGGMSATFQTSDDGGTTYFDVARTSIASANGAGADCQWLSIPVCGGPTTRASVVAVGSVISVNTCGTTASASTLGTGQYNGLPVLGIQNRIFVIGTAAITAASSRIKVLVNSQSRNA